MKTIDVTQFKRPNVFQIFWTSLFMGDNSARLITLPKKVAQYELVQDLSKVEAKRKRFAVGKYSDGNENVFIKTWQGERKNLDYFMLVNEIRSCYILNLYEQKIGAGIKIPKIKGIFGDKKTLSVVFEYVEGVPLSSFTIERQANVLNSSIIFLEKISDTLSPADKAEFIKRSFSLYFFWGIFCLIQLSVSNLKEGVPLFKIFIQEFFSSVTHSNRKLTLAHRDLKPQNILINEEIIYIVDFENVVLTLPGYDRAYISVEPDVLSLNSEMMKSPSDRANSFLRHYLQIHFAFNFRSFPDRKKYYLSFQK